MSRYGGGGYPRRDNTSSRYAPYGGGDGRGGRGAPGPPQGPPPRRDERSGWRDDRRRPSPRRHPPRRERTPPRRDPRDGRDQRDRRDRYAAPVPDRSRHRFSPPRRDRDRTPDNTSLTTLLPFGQRRREVVELLRRNPSHRIPPTLCFVDANVAGVRPEELHFLETPAMCSVSRQPVGMESGIDDVVNQATRAAGEGEVCVRVLLVAGRLFPAAQPSEHPLRRLSLVCVHDGGRNQDAELMFYGGCVPDGDDDAIAAAAAELVKQQSGVDLSAVERWHKLCTFEYDCPNPTSIGGPRRRTVFLMPDLRDVGELEPKPLAEQRQDEYVSDEVVREEVVTEEEVSPEGMDVDDGQPKVLQTVRKVIETPVQVTKQRLQFTTRMVPVDVSLADLLHRSSNRGGRYQPSAEVACACTVFDDLCRQVCSEYLVDFLTRKTASDGTLAAELAAETELEDKHQAEMNKLRDEEAALSQQKEDALREQWAEDDEGKTQEEIDEDNEGRASVVAEERAAIRATYDARRGEIEQERRKVRRRPVHALDSKALASFEWFDRATARGRGATGSLSAQLLTQVFLCAHSDMPAWEAADLLRAAGRGSRYTDACRTRSLQLDVSVDGAERGDGQAVRRAD